MTPEERTYTKMSLLDRSISAGTAILTSPKGEEFRDLRRPAIIYVWFRWLLVVAFFVEFNIWVEDWTPVNFLHAVCAGLWTTLNAFVHWKIHFTGRVNATWLFILSAIDILAISFGIMLTGGFESWYFYLYYPSLALFIWIFTSPHLGIAWAVTVTAIYISVGLVSSPEPDAAAFLDKVFLYKVTSLFAVAVLVNLLARTERLRWQDAVERERELHRQRIELSQGIHDTTAQSAFMFGLGVESAIRMIDGCSGDPCELRKLRDRLVALDVVSKSTMWTLRHPINDGYIFRGSSLSDVLSLHTETFTTITSIPVQLVGKGDEPPLTVTSRSLLFSIAHNALTNAFRHASARSVTVDLEFGSDEICLSVTDDGVGLPENYSVRGHGIQNMREAAQRLGGILTLESDADGTTVSCTLPYSEVQEVV